MRVRGLEIPGWGAEFRTLDKVFSRRFSRLVKSSLSTRSRLDVVRYGKYKSITFVEYGVRNDMLSRGFGLPALRLLSCRGSLESAQLAVVAAPIALFCGASSISVTVNLV